MIALATILALPDETRTRQLLWRILAISIFSANVSSDNSGGTSPSQRPFASECLGIFDWVSAEAQLEQMLSHPVARAGLSKPSRGSDSRWRSLLVNSGEMSWERSKPDALVRSDARVS